MSKKTYTPTPVFDTLEDVIDQYKSMFIYINLGGKDGITNNSIGYVFIHEAAVYQFRVKEWNNTTTSLEGWYLPFIGKGTKIIVLLHENPTVDIFKCFKEEGIEPIPWKKL